MKIQTRYDYYNKNPEQAFEEIDKVTQGVIKIGNERLNPKLRNPDFLILRQRRKNLERWIKKLSLSNLLVLDIGGRIQPYRSLFESKIINYFAIDPQVSGLIDIVAVGEKLPFKENSFDVIISTQVLSYAVNPFKVISEGHRVLKNDGVFMLSVPAFFPMHHDECWRFFPDGLMILFSKFSKVQIEPEGYSAIGMLRTLNVLLNMTFDYYYLKRLLELIIFPLINSIGLIFEGQKSGSLNLTANFCVFAKK